MDSLEPSSSEKCHLKLQSPACLGELIVSQPRVSSAICSHLPSFFV